jgi:hypothetical protein
MRGSVVKKAGRWYVIIERPPDPETGKRRQHWHSGFRTRREAEQKRVGLLSAAHSGTYVDHPRQTLAEFMDDWFPTVERTVRPSTLESYRRNVRLHVLPHIGAVRLHQLDAGVLNGIYSDLLRTGRHDGKGLSPRTVHVHTIVHRGPAGRRALGAHGAQPGRCR